MSRRFGRNQRRRAREEATALRWAIDQSLETLKTAQRHERSAREDAARHRAKATLAEIQLTAAREVLGASIALPPVDEILDRLDFAAAERLGHFRMQKRETMSDIRLLTPIDNLCMEMCVDLHYRTLDVIEGGLELDDRAKWREPHAYLRSHGPNGDMAYAVNLQSLRQINTQRAIDDIARMLATNLVNDLKRSMR